ncbi:MAG: type III-B CRISPR-associated protein Cas10/Cmr2 [Gammaproteobacteria bacterium RIFOXYA12_FULL_61_12]|nr:MAG: type III-B CRISPR-associated protein Cas10/Cmr2 [Gammaproteobacteria bacterium RIFOXYD12_FULL_61_37]OGT93474.1 MAG: type III-B CRISPR-associated protein Cas10/Cmr2 [Gammaproteobacteria bacterium RIFOXYA12_FULL_61_12]
MNNDLIWQTKLAARVHDPAEKALVLLRDPAGHEGGSIVGIGKALGFETNMVRRRDGTQVEKLNLPPSMEHIVERADWWVAAADRPKWPMQEITVTTKKGEQKTFGVAPWAQVHWTNKPVLIHPLTGDQLVLGKHGDLGDTELDDIKQRSFEHFSRLVIGRAVPDMAATGRPMESDYLRTLLAYWRFGPELIEEEDNGKLGALWGVLPADTRVPDHSIWDHLDLTSAFAGAFAADPDGDAALLALSIGPVQGFIASARTTSDLWAGSHLLSRLAWEAMKPVCEALGPDAILFPRLRGVPQVDLWLRGEMNLPDELFKDCEWAKRGTDANPLFSAALPNRFVAVVPASRAKALAEEVSRKVRKWLQDQGQGVVDRLLETAGLANESVQHAHRQMREQLEGFPEVHWAAVPFSLIHTRNKAKQTDLDVSLLSSAMAPFFGVEAGQPCGFLAQPAWQALQKEIDWGDGTVFFAPNPGVLYPAVYDLAERVLAAAKSTRAFDQTEQKGWRCSLTGEAEWLTTDPAQLLKSYRQQTDTLWVKVAAKKPAWAKKGEHLSALPAIKRLWPTLFAEEVGLALAAGERGEQETIGRFVVSTHTMALAHQLDQWLARGGLTSAGFKQAIGHADPVALPRRLMSKHARNPVLVDAKRIPGLLEAARDADDDAALEQAQRLVRQTLAQGTDKGEEIKLETYYALLMMDGDRMGAWLSGGDDYAIPYRKSFHPQVQDGFDKHAAKQKLIQAYGAQKRALSPNRHLAISGALNDFSLSVVRHVVEEEHLGRVIYAGGDDVLAMLPVSDLLSSMQRLRLAYSGDDPAHEGGRDPRGLTLQNGFAMLKGKLMRMMGTKATASCGAVIAHHQAPLGAVMRELREAEKRAKNEGERDAFSITVIKRSGGALRLTEKWGEPVMLLGNLRDFLSDKATSRRAVYHSLEWMTDLPDPKGKPEILASLLGYQFDRQIKPKEKERVREEHKVSDLARRLASLAAAQPKDSLKWLENFLTVAEFLARETRAGEQA